MRGSSPAACSSFRRCSGVCPPDHGALAAPYLMRSRIGTTALAGSVGNLPLVSADNKSAPHNLNPAPNKLAMSHRVSRLLAMAGEMTTRRTADLRLRRH